MVALDTLYTDQPTLAASAYLAKVPPASSQPSGNPSSIYCTQLGGTDAFGGVNASGGGWAKADASNVISLCIFPDLSSIDSWGLTQYSALENTRTVMSRPLNVSIAVSRLICERSVTTSAS